MEVNEVFVPPATVMSSSPNVADASERVNVMVVVCPTLKVPTGERASVTVGAVVSTFCAACVPTKT